MNDSSKNIKQNNCDKKIKLTYDKENLREIIDELKNYFDFLPLATPKIYFSGESDSHQSKFERASNNLEIAVISTNKELACVLLRFVRIIIDEKPKVLIFTIEDDDVPEELTVCEIFKRLFEIENLYISSFKLTDKLT